MKKPVILVLFILHYTHLLGETLDPQTIEDLHLNINKHSSLVDKLGPTHTTVGRNALQKILSNPTTSIDRISARQNFIRELVKSEELREKLKSALKSYNNHESSLDTFVKSDLRAHLFWKWEQLNSKTALSIYHSLPLEITTSIAHFLFNSLIYYMYGNGNFPSLNMVTCGPSCSHHVNRRTEKPAVHHVHDEKSFDGMFCYPCNSKSFDMHRLPKLNPSPPKGSEYPGFNCEKNSNSGSTDTKSNHFSRSTSTNSSMFWNLLLKVSFVNHTAEHINGLIQSMRQYSQRREQIREAYRELRSISHSLQASKDIRALVGNRADVIDKQPDQLQGFFNILPSVEELFTEEIPTTLLGRQKQIGKTLVAYRFLSMNKSNFSIVAEYIGLVDAYLTIAELFVRHLGKDNSFSWVEFSSNATNFAAKGIWNPLLQSNVAVANDIFFDVGKNKMILTGANASGKSIFASTIAINTLLAQSFGVSAAKHLKFQPFNNILTHIHFSDDVNQGLSTMKAELKIIGQILKKISDQPGTQLIIFDDSLFKGTSTKVGEKLAFKTFHKLASKAPEAIVIGVTHYDGLIQAVQSDHMLSDHYRLAYMDIKEADVDQWYPTYKLKFGTIDRINPLVLLPKEELFEAFGY